MNANVDAPAQLPLVSVVVEGFNEVALATSLTDVLEALMAQDYPLECVELILVGDEARYRDWLADYGHGSRLHGAMAVPVPDGTLYYELKNLGAAQASGEIIAFVDSDVHPDPGWLSAIVRGISRGADVVSGVSAFWSRGRFRPPGPLLEAAASVCWGHTAARQPSSGEGSQPSGGLLAHNVAGRADVIRRIPFRTESGRNCGSSLFFADLKASGARIDFLPDQRVNHSFAPTWFLYPLHLRVGWEEHVTRRITQSRRSRVLRRLGPLEPPVVALIATAADLRAWPLYSRALGHPPRVAVLRFPLVFAASLAARTAGMLGEYAALVMPQRSRAWAEAQ